MNIDAQIKAEKKKVFKITLRVFLLGFFIVAGLFGYALYLLFFDMNGLPTGEFLTEETSPDGSYTLRAYVTNGGATTSYAIRGELVMNHKNNKTKNIYWNHREETADISRVDDDTVIINGYSLDVPNEKFDFRNE